MNAGPFGWYVSVAGVNARRCRRSSCARSGAARRAGARERRVPPRAFRRGRGGRGGRAGARRPKKQTEEAEAEEEEEEEEKKKKKKEEKRVRGGSRMPGRERRAVGERRRRRGPAAALRASFGPVSLAVALEVLARKRSKPAGAGPGCAGGARRRQRRMGKKPRPSPRPGPRPRRRRRASAGRERRRAAEEETSAVEHQLYFAEARASLPEGLKVPEQAKLLGASWKALSEEERSKGSGEVPPRRRVATPRPTAAISEPKKRRNARTSAYLLYCAEARASLDRGAEGDGTGEAARHGVEEPRGFRAVQVRTRGGGGESSGGEGVNANDATLYEYP